MPPRFPIACLLLVSAFAAQGQQYRWIDEKGRVQYSDTPPPANAKDVRKKTLRVESAPAGQEAFALQVARKSSPVKLYSSPDCGPACDDARKLLVQRGIPFSETSVTQATQVEELKRVSGGSVVPVMLVGSEVQKGFGTETYHRALDNAGYPRDNPPRAAGPGVTAPSAGAPAGPTNPATTQPDKPATK